MADMAGLWSLDRLAAEAHEPESRLRRYADVGLLRRQPNGEFEPDSLHRLRLIQFARTRGVGDAQLEAATASQGDLLGIFDDLAPPTTATLSLVDTARQLGLDDVVISELAELLDWDDVGSGTESDIDSLRLLAKALELGLPRDALMQLVRVFADATDRLADAVVRTFHNYVHDRFRALDAAGRLTSKTAVHRLVNLTLAGLQP
jgi:adenylate cyclase